MVQPTATSFSFSDAPPIEQIALPTGGTQASAVPFVDNAVSTATVLSDTVQLPISSAYVAGVPITATPIPTITPDTAQPAGIDTPILTVVPDTVQPVGTDTPVPTVVPDLAQSPPGVPESSATSVSVVDTAVPDSEPGMPQSAHKIFLPGIFKFTTPVPVADDTPLDLTAVPTQDEGIAEIIIYDDTLDPNWSIEQSSGVTIDMMTTEYVYNSTVAAAITPQVAFGRFLLTVRENAEAVYAYDDILGVSFRLSGGANLIENDDLAVTVLGSNAFTYWVPNDTSVQVDREVSEDAPLFSETRLYYLDINQSIPPDTWVEVIVWLDNLQFDPVYQYITGMYIKNDEDFLQPYYVDRVSLLLNQS